MQESVIVLETKWGWLDMLTSVTESQGKSASAPAGPRESSSLFVYFKSALMLTRLVIEKDATWPSTEISFNKFCISESETSIEN